MSKHKNATDLLNFIKKGAIVSGEFRVKKGSNVLMDIDAKNIKFRNCKILNADFCSSIFSNCIFDNVLIRNSALVGVTFNKCNFVKCKFSNTQLGVSVKDCKVKGLIITKEAF